MEPNEFSNRGHVSNRNNRRNQRERDKAPYRGGNGEGYNSYHTSSTPVITAAFLKVAMDACLGENDFMGSESAKKRCDLAYSKDPIRFNRYYSGK